METELKLLVGTNKDSELIFSLHDNRFLFIHADYLSSQWPLESIGVEIVVHTNAHIKIYHRESSAYQNWIVDISYEEAIVSFFKAIGFSVGEKLPVPNVSDIPTSIH